MIEQAVVLRGVEEPTQAVPALMTSGEAQPAMRPQPQPLQLDVPASQEQAAWATQTPYAQNSPYVMPTPLPMMWPQTPNSLPPTPQGHAPMMWPPAATAAPAPQVAHVDVEHAMWPQSPAYGQQLLLQQSQQLAVQQQ